MRIKLTSIFVEDQAEGLAFYTEVLGFKKKHDIPLGEFRWITVVSPEGPDDVELVLEPSANPAAKTFQAAMLEQGIPLAAFEVSDLAAEHARLTGLGVAFTRPPTAMGPVSIAIFSDTCGNLIQLYQPTG
ncbi:MAG: VOC family protein [Planctomycetes bacterium]|nr:VOC family protein [Planctomycetota bacterium]